MKSDFFLEWGWTKVIPLLRIWAIVWCNFYHGIVNDQAIVLHTPEIIYTILSTNCLATCVMKDSVTLTIFVAFCENSFCRHLKTNKVKYIKVCTYLEGKFHKKYIQIARFLPKNCIFEKSPQIDFFVHFFPSYNENLFSLNTTKLRGWHHP